MSVKVPIEELEHRRDDVAQLRGQMEMLKGLLTMVITHAHLMESRLDERIVEATSEKPMIDDDQGYDLEKNG